MCGPGMDRRVSDDAHHESNRAFYDRISRAYDFISDASEHEAREAGERMLALAAGEQVLEIGFGTGNSILHLAAAVGSEGRVSGIDVSEGMLGVARKKVAERDLSERVHLQLGDGRHLPYEAGEFDAVFLSFTLELFPESEIPAVLAEVRRVLRDGGRLALVAMAHVTDEQHPSLLERAYVWMHRHFPHIVDCRPIDVESSLSASGFAMSEHRTVEMWTMPVSVALAVKPG